MNVDSSMCASSGKASHWDQLDWSKYERQVRRLQARIVKATREGRWGKVQTLQRLLTHSFSGKALAVKRVTDNQGRHTPGVDRILWKTPACKHKAIGTLRRHDCRRRRRDHRQRTENTAGSGADVFDRSGSVQFLADRKNQLRVHGSDHHAMLRPAQARLGTSAAARNGCPGTPFSAGDRTRYIDR